MPDVAALLKTDARLRRFYQVLTKNELGETYEAAHARLAIEALATAHVRLEMLTQGKLKPLPNSVSQSAAINYISTRPKTSQRPKPPAKLLRTFH